MTEITGNPSLSKAFVKAYNAIKHPKLNANNPHFKSKFADLGEVLKVVREACEPCGLGVIQAPVGERQLETILIHESGDSVSYTMEMAPTKATPQAVGSNITYMRRYALMSLFGLFGDDDDGNEASRPQETAHPLRRSESAEWFISQGVQHDRVNLKTKMFKLGFTAPVVKEILISKFSKEKFDNLSAYELKTLERLVDSKEVTP